MRIILVGCGAMGSAMLECWIASHSVDVENLHVVAPNWPRDNLGFYTRKANFHQHQPDAIASLKDEAVDMVILAPRPQKMAEILPAYQIFAEQGASFLTVAAGLRESFYRNILGDNTPIIRVMPNMPTAIGKGMNAVYYNDYVTDAVKAQAQKLLAALGETESLTNEDDMDGFTVLAGCGPAYLYLLVESMALAAEKMGFEKAQAESIAIETVLGSAEYLKENDACAKDLIAEIALPGGVTEHALSHLCRDDAFSALMMNAMQSACLHSRNMNKKFSP